MKDQDIIAASMADQEELERLRKLATLTRELFRYLDTVEESDEGRTFHPVTISCCRAGWTEGLERVLAEMKVIAVGGKD